MSEPNFVTPKQANWFAKVRAGLESETGKSLGEWIEIARACPETSHGKRVKWFKEEHGIGVNRASIILGAAFETGLGWDNPQALLDALWKSPELRATYDAIESYAISIADDVIVGPRKTFSGFSRKYQFAAARPVKGKVRLGLAIDPVEYHLEKSKASDNWSDRLTSVIIVPSANHVNKSVQALIRTAWAGS